jgi:hypothetical protein
LSILTSKIFSQADLIFYTSKLNNADRFLLPTAEWTSRAGKSEGFFSKGSQENPHRVCVAPDLSANAEH